MSFVNSFLKHSKPIYWKDDVSYSQNFYHKIEITDDESQEYVDLVKNVRDVTVGFNNEVKIKKLYRIQQPFAYARFLHYKELNRQKQVRKFVQVLNIEKLPIILRSNCDYRTKYLSDTLNLLTNNRQGHLIALEVIDTIRFLRDVTNDAQICPIYLIEYETPEAEEPSICEVKTDKDETVSNVEECDVHIPLCLKKLEEVCVTDKMQSFVPNKNILNIIDRDDCNSPLPSFSNIMISDSEEMIRKKHDIKIHQLEQTVVENNESKAETIEGLDVGICQAKRKRCEENVLSKGISIGNESIGIENISKLTDNEHKCSSSSKVFKADSDEVIHQTKRKKDDRIIDLLSKTETLIKSQEEKSNLAEPTTVQNDGNEAEMKIIKAKHVSEDEALNASTSFFADPICTHQDDSKVGITGCTLKRSVSDDQYEVHKKMKLETESNINTITEKKYSGDV